MTNSAPSAGDDYYSILHDTMLSDPAPGVLWNDWDDDGDAITAALVSGPSHAASFTFNSDGSFDYEPTALWTGQDQFIYSITDDIATTQATVYIDVTNNAPFAGDDYYSILHDTVLSDPAPGVLWNDWDDDGDALSVTLASGPANAAAFSLFADGAFDYTPMAGYVGTDSFTYIVSDGIDSSNIATAYIEVTNSAPFAEDDYYSIVHDTVLNDPAPGVLWNDWDDDGDAISAALVIGPSNAVSFTFNSDGSFDYEPPALWTGQDQFTYEVSDGIDTAQAIAYIDVTNNAPFADDDYYETYMSVTLEVSPPGVLDNDFDDDGDPFVANLVSGPSFGTLTFYGATTPLAPGDSFDGGFEYTPQPGFEGTDTFTYRAYDAIDESNDATVFIQVLRPEVDLDTDSDNTTPKGGPDGSQEEDDVEMDDPGNVVWKNADDDNGNGQVDYLDGGPFQDDNGNSVSDDDLEELEISYTPDATTLAGFKVELATGGNNIKLWETQAKQPLQASYTIGVGGGVPSTIYVEGIDVGQATVTATLKDPAGNVIHSDEVKITVVFPNLTGYRPQTEGPGYGDPFPRTAVPFAKEADPGVGIRRNGDDDDGNGAPDLSDTAVNGENDLIEVELFMPTLPGIDYVLKRDNDNIHVWKTKDKTGPLLTTHSNNENTLTCAASQCTAWVEWVEMAAGETASLLTLEVRTDTSNPATDGQPTFKDTLKFYPFTSVVIAFGGNGVAPLNPANGSFIIAVQLYNDGYDVHAYDEETADDNPSPPYDEVVNAVQNRGVTEVAALGYSQGGGATKVLTDNLVASQTTIGTFTIPFTAYIDGVRHNGWNPETGLPGGSGYHVNYYQRNGGGALNLMGDAVPGARNVNVTNWTPTLDHFAIDNDGRVIDRIQNGDGTNHDGLKDRVTR